MGYNIDFIYHIQGHINSYCGGILHRLIMSFENDLVIIIITNSYIVLTEHVEQVITVLNQQYFLFLILIQAAGFILKL